MRARIVLGGAMVLTVSMGAALAQDALKARQNEMKAFGQRMGAIKTIAVDKQGSLADAATAAEFIAGKAPQIPGWFPAGTGAGETRALPAIWERPADFQKAAANMQSLAQAVAAAAKSGDQAATAAAFGKLGQDGCNGCHTPFRRPQS